MTRVSYTCDHCGTPVGLHDSRCPKCGKAFDAVRCPKCGHQGSPQAFSDGCPRCGYLARPGRPPRKHLFTPAMTVLLVLLVLAGAVAWALRAG